MEAVDLIKEKRIRLGKVLRAIRKALGKTLEEIAGQADLDAGNLSRIERGLQGVADDTMELIAKALGVSVSQIHAISEKFLSDEQLKRKAEELIAGQGPMRACRGDLVLRRERQTDIDALPNGARRFVKKFAQAATNGTLSPRKIELFEQMLDEFVKDDDDEKTDR